MAVLAWGRFVASTFRSLGSFFPFVEFGFEGTGLVGSGSCLAMSEELGLSVSAVPC